MCFVLPCTATTVFGLEVRQGCKISKVVAKTNWVMMSEVWDADGINVLDGGFVSINNVCPRKVLEFHTVPV